ncbi:MAG: hypothetical protein D6719_06645 [Candidatus Dadabacteria bacterium]|nr:MAG: hypothetical protein D6719_06645 [Candidatus Dadabacteria bacterium]
MALQAIKVNRKLRYWVQMNRTRTKKQVDYYLWPAAIVVFFLILAVLNARLIYKAFTSHPGYISKSPYRDGITYQREIDALKRGEHYGLTARFSTNAENILLKLTAKLPLPKEFTVSARFIKPASKTSDFTIQFQKENELLYSAKLPHKLSGLWLVKLEINTESEKIALPDKKIFF